MFIFCLIIFAIIIGGSGFMFFSYENRIRQLKRDVMIANSHVSSLRSKLPKDSASTNNSNTNFNIKSNIEINFLPPSEKAGIVNEQSNLYICPLLNSPYIFKTTVKMEVTIIDRAESSGTLWYYVMLPVDTNINSRGWIKKSDFAFFYSKNTGMTKV